VPGGPCRRAMMARPGDACCAPADHPGSPQLSASMGRRRRAGRWYPGPRLATGPRGGRSAWCLPSAPSRPAADGRSRSASPAARAAPSTSACHGSSGTTHRAVAGSAPTSSTDGSEDPGGGPADWPGSCRGGAGTDQCLEKCRPRCPPRRCHGLVGPAAAAAGHTLIDGTMRRSRSTSVPGFAINMRTYVRQRAAAHGCEAAECRSLAPPMATVMRPTG
jgi:hypothetical protein